MLCKSRTQPSRVIDKICAVRDSSGEVVGYTAGRVGEKVDRSAGSTTPSCTTCRVETGGQWKFWASSVAHTARNAEVVGMYGIVSEAVGM